MSNQKRLKEQNQPLIVGGIVAHGLAFAFIVLPPHDLISLMNAGNWGRAAQLIGGSCVSFIGILLLSLIVRGMFPSLWRDRLVHWHWHHPLPGCRAFTQYGPKDPRVNMATLNEHYGPLPSDPRDQNTLFYAIYKKYQDAPGVLDAHKAYLALRDISTITLLFVAPLPLAVFLLGAAGSVALIYFTCLVALYVATSWAAKVYATRLIENTLAAAS